MKVNLIKNLIFTFICYIFSGLHLVLNVHGVVLSYSTYIKNSFSIFIKQFCYNFIFIKHLHCYTFQYVQKCELIFVFFQNFKTVIPLPLELLRFDKSILCNISDLLNVSRFSCSLSLSIITLFKQEVTCVCFDLFF